MRKKIWALLLAVLLVMMAGCGKQAAVETKAPLVKTQAVSFGDGSASATYAGVVRGRYETNMAFQVSGQILSRNVQLGDRVQAGQTLMTIDPKDVAQKASQGDAAVEAARAQLSLAQANLTRYSQLYQQEAIAAAVLDQYQTAYDAAFASYQNALAQAAQGHNALSYTNLVAGADGVISAVNAEAGQVVAAGQTVMTLVQSGELEIEVHVPENHLMDVPVGKAVSVSFWALNNATAEGTVREVAPMADSTARTYKVRISVPNPPAGMGLGMTASVQVGTANAAVGQNVMVLPLSAIYQTEGTPQVWIVDSERRVSLKSVKVETFDDNKVKVTGLKEGDVVVIAGVHKLHDGEEVRLAEGDRS